ncbi:MAG: radical SAM protein [Candidatus Bathyarchaeia archaeon]
MARVYLLNPPFMPNFNRELRGEGMSTRGGTLYYPIWLSYATGLLEQFHEVRLVDAIARRWTLNEVLKDVKAFSPNIIVVDSNFASIFNDLNVAKELKKETDAILVIVGPPTSQFTETILQSGSVDIVARYEYDYTLLEIADKFESNNFFFKEIKGISYRTRNRIRHNPNREFSTSEDLDRLPFVSKVYKTHLNIKDYFLSSSLYPVVQIFTGRGCPFQCTFCSWPQTFMGHKYRVRSVSNVIEEFEWISENLRVNEVFFEDDTFTINKKRVLEFCEEYEKRGLDIAWACNARVGLDYETMKAMKNAGCRLLIVGYESGSDEILKKINKGITVQQIKDFAKNARKAGLLVHGDFIVGLPGETKETIEMTRKLIKEVKPDILQVQVATPLLGTTFYQWCKKNGYIMTEDPNDYINEHGNQKSIVSYPWLSAEEIVQAVDGILKEYYVSISYVPLALKQVFRRNGFCELKRLAKSAKMFVKYAFRK